MGLKVFPERCYRRAISYLEGEGVPKNWGIMTQRISKVFDLGTFRSKMWF